MQVCDPEFEFQAPSSRWVQCLWFHCFELGGRGKGSREGYSQLAWLPNSEQRAR